MMGIKNDFMNMKFFHYSTSIRANVEGFPEKSELNPQANLQVGLKIPNMYSAIYRPDLH